MKYINLLLTGIILLASCQRSLTDYVNPFVGTDGHGHTFPGAILPFGMVQVSPDTRLDGWDGCSGYHYSDDTIYGFSHTHLSGTGCSDYGDLLIMPFTSENGDIPEQLDYSFYKSSFSHRNEKAEPGYYRVVLDRNRVLAELTAHKRTALHKYTFPSNGGNGIVIDLSHRDVVINSCLALHEDPPQYEGDPMTKIICGYRTSAAWNPEQHFNFAIVADSPIEKVVFYKDGHPVKDQDYIEGEDCKAMVYFEENDKEVTLYVGISATDHGGAMNNLFEGLESDEDKVITFNQAKKEASAIWEKALSQFEVKGGSREDRGNFYTALYHCMTSPYLFSDADGGYRAMKDTTGNYSIDFTGNGREQYTVFSVWDTYRALHPLLNISDPSRSADFIRSFMSHYRRSGELTMWELAGHETHCMIGYNVASVILDAYRTGVIDSTFDIPLEELLDAMVKTSNLPILGRRDYARDGFLSSEYENESVSKTLEYSYDDWCIAEFARLIGNETVYKQYMRRCQSWKNIMDADGFMHPRRNGGFVTPFNPTEVNNHFTEANSWQYSSYVPHDIEGWTARMGGEEKACQFLDSLFNGSSEMTGREQSDITGLIGQYAHGNEPSHHAAYLYAYLGQQWKSAELVRKICNELYHNTPDGLCGNEDCGQMSAWYVMSALGFYAVCPGSGEYVIGSPLFDKVVIHLQNGKDITINAKGQNNRSPYIKSLKLNGISYNKSYITIEMLKDGCQLDFEMSSSPVKKWASSHDDCPHSSIPAGSIITLAPLFNDWQQGFYDNTTVAINTDRLNPGDSVYYTIDGSTPTRLSTPYCGPLEITNDAMIKAVTYSPTTGYSAVVTHKLTKGVNDCKVTYVTKPAPQYYENGEAGLTDRLHGTSNYRIGGWQGWQGDMEVVVDLLEPRVVNQVGVECLENMKSWIFFPSRVEIEVSEDGKQYRPFGKVENTLFPATLERQDLETVHNFSVAGPPATVRYVRIKAKNYGKLPKWHVSAGEQAWFFVDEIEIN